MKRLLAILTGLVLLAGMGQLAQADWKYNPFTGKLDYHETGLPTAGAAGDIVYYDGSNWQVLTAGVNGLILTLNTGLPTWQSIGAHAMSVHSDEDTYTINTSGDFTADDGVLDKLECNESFTYDATQTATGDGTTTIDWGLGNVFYFTFGAANETFTFTAPPGIAVLYLALKQDATGSRTATWPATVDWPGNVAPTLTTTANYVDVITFIWTGTDYLGIANYDFR